MNNPVKFRAIQLRKSGKSYNEIASQLNLSSKGTLSYWLHKIPLDKKALSKIKHKKEKSLNKARLAAQAKNKKLRKIFLENIKKNVYALKKNVGNNKDSMKLALAFLYLGEGSKWKSHRGLQLGSSEPEIIALYLTLLERCYSIDRKLLHCYICYRADQNLNALKSFWSRKAHIPLKNFYSSSPDKRTVGKPTKNRNYKGVCVISGGDTKTQLELEMIPRIITGL